MIRERDEDVDFDEMIQRDVDDRWEAYLEGRKIGQQLGSPEMNLHPVGSEKRAAWERGRLSALSERQRAA